MRNHQFPYFIPYQAVVFLCKINNEYLYRDLLYSQYLEVFSLKTPTILAQFLIQWLKVWRKVLVVLITSKKTLKLLQNGEIFKLFRSGTANYFWMPITLSDILWKTSQLIFVWFYIDREIRCEGILSLNSSVHVQENISYLLLTC